MFFFIPFFPENFPRGTAVIATVNKNIFTTQFCIILFKLNSFASWGSATAGAAEMNAAINEAIKDIIII